MIIATAISDKARLINCVQGLATDRFIPHPTLKGPPAPFEDQKHYLLLFTGTLEARLKFAPDSLIHIRFKADSSSTKAIYVAPSPVGYQAAFHISETSAFSNTGHYSTCVRSLSILDTRC